METSYERIVKWKEQMKKLHEDPKLLACTGS